MRQALEKHKGIDIKKINFGHGNTASIYIDIIDGCFEVGLSDEGFSLMEQVNSLPISSALLAKMKSSISDSKLKSIVSHAI